jgi:HEAT repeat protein
VREAALRALGRIAGPQAIRVLTAELEVEGPVPLGDAVLAPVRRALASSGKPGIDALGAIVAAAPSRRLASAAALALGQARAPEAAPAIVRAAQRGAVVLDAALEALGALGDRRALAFVLEHLDDPDARVRELAVGVASVLLDPSEGDGRAVDVVEPRLLDPTTSLGERVELVRLLGRTGSARALAPLLALGRTRSLAIRIAVAEALGALGQPAPAAEATLLAALADASQALRLTAAMAIGRIGGDATARALLQRLGVAAEQDREALGIALSGVLARVQDPGVVLEVERRLGAAPPTAREALLEGLGRTRAPGALALLERLAASSDPDDRRKVAEALAGHGDAGAERVLLVLARDVDAGVRAGAAWSLGRVAGAPAVTTLVGVLGDDDAGVAGNAAVALGAVAARAGRTEPALGALCAALDDWRSYVRAQALVGLRALAASCGGAHDGAERRLLLRARHWRVRMAAAELLQSRSAGAGEAASLDRRALERCAAEDHDATVAAYCAGETPPSRVAKAVSDVLVFVVPDGGSAPGPRAPFALVLADGRMRLGVADRRGAVFEQGAPAGPIELAVPAALAGADPRRPAGAP